MAHDRKINLLGELEELLDRERDDLVQGKLENLEGVTRHKERLIEAVASLDAVDSKPLARLRAKVERNQSLLDSAAKGIRAVAERMAELRQVRQGLCTYDEAGKRNDHLVITREKLEKRA